MPPVALAGGRLPWLVAAALVAATGVLYAQVAGHPFIFFDDNRYLAENPVVQRGLSWSGVAWAFTTFRVANWHPLTWLSHMLDVQLFGMDAGAHHLVNVALHAANAALLFLALLRMTGAPGRSAIVAALFALHPLHVESVAWVAERKDVLSTLFGLLALLAYARFAERPRLRTYVPVAAAFALSLLAKPMWVTLPFLLLLLDAWPLGRWRGLSAPGPAPRAQVAAGRLLLEKAPLLALSLASAAMTLVAQRSGGAVEGLDLGIGARLGNAAVAYVRYVGKTVWPGSLAIFYPHPGNGIPAWQSLGAAALLLAATALAISRARRTPWVAVGWCWFLGTLVPVIGILQVGGQAMADRYTYLPATGLFLAAVWEADRLFGARRRWELGAAAVVLLAALSAVTHHQLRYWSSHEALFRHALEVTPVNGTAHGVLSEELRRQGRLPESLAEAQEAVRDAPEFAIHWNNLALSLDELGRRGEAREALLRAIALDRSFPISWSNLARVSLALGNLDEAEHAALQATILAPGDATGWFRLGLVRTRLGRPQDAVAAYEKAVEAAPDHFGAWTNLAALHQSSGRLGDAERAFEAAIQADPGSRVGWRNLGVFLAGAGRFPEALRAFDGALRLGPADPDVLRRIGLAQAAMGARAEALATAAQLDRIDPAAAQDVRAHVLP